MKKKIKNLTKKSLGRLLSSNNETIKRLALGILRELQRERQERRATLTAK